LFLPHIDNILSIVSKYSTHEQEQTAQTALFTIKLCAKRLAEKHPTEFSSVSCTKVTNRDEDKFIYVKKRQSKFSLLTRDVIQST